MGYKITLLRKAPECPLCGNPLECSVTWSRNLQKQILVEKQEEEVVTCEKCKNCYKIEIINKEE